MTSKKTDRNDCIGIFNRPPAALARHIDSDKQNLMVRLLILPMEQDHSSGVKQQMNKMMNLKTGRSSHFQLKCVGKQNNNNLKNTKNQPEQDRALSPNTFKRMGCIVHTHTHRCKVIGRNLLTYFLSIQGTLAVTVFCRKERQCQSGAGGATTEVANTFQF